MSKSTLKKKPAKPKKPYPDFPLFPHATGRWAKKIKGKFHYFGPWDDWQAALERFDAQKADLYAGRTPRVTGDALTVKGLANKFLTAKQQLVATGELSPRSFADYHATCKRLGEAFGWTRSVDDIAADDFRQLRANIAKVWGPVRLGNEIQRVRSVFRFGYDEGLIDRPVRYGQGFQRPSATVLRKHRTANGPRMFEADEIRQMLDTANPQLRAMILLGVNCGFGNSDVANLPQKALNLPTAWLNYPRPKTGIQRRCPLWPETVAALREALADRPKPADKAYAGLVFITKYGQPWSKGSSDNPVSKETAKLLRRLKIQRRGLGFYGLRHTFQTIGDEARDPVAVASIMGHAPTSNDMSAVYRERISDERLQAVTDHVRRWLFSDIDQKETKQ